MRLHQKSGRGTARQGAVLLWLVLSLSVIIIVIALGTDGGRIMEERRRVQAAADVAALAAAARLYEHYLDDQGRDPDTLAAAAARQAAASNGYTDDGSGTSVTINIPPLYGPFAGKADYVEVIVTSQLSGTFSAAFTSASSAVKARAVAVGRPRPLGLTLLSPSGAGAFSNSGNGSVEVVGGPIIVNSSDPAAFSLSGSSSTKAAYHEIVGGMSGQGGTLVGQVETGADPVPDPLRTLPSPNLADYVVRSTERLSPGSNDEVVLNPGIYQGGISISGDARVTLSPGIYIIDGGGFSLSGNGSLTAERVMIYNTGTSHAAPVEISGSSSVTLTPPMEGPYQGISVFQDRTLSQTVQLSGNGGLQITGTVYAAGATVSLSGNSSAGMNLLGGGYVANKLSVSGSASFSVTMGANRPRVPEVRLVE